MLNRILVTLILVSGLVLSQASVADEYSDFFAAYYGLPTTNTVPTTQIPNGSHGYTPTPTIRVYYSVPPNGGFPTTGQPTMRPVAVGPQQGRPCNSGCNSGCRPRGLRIFSVCRRCFGCGRRC